MAAALFIVLFVADTADCDGGTFANVSRKHIYLSFVREAVSQFI